MASTPTDKARMKRSFALFDAVVELTAAEREACLARECHGDPELRAAVERMLEADSRAEFAGTAAERYAVLLEPRSAGVSQPVDAERSDPPRPIVGQFAGVWRLLELLGQGGTGSVYLGERTDGAFEQRVAVKVLRSGLDAERFAELLRREQRILARLEHPAIARILDAGMLVDGSPFVAIEYVEGRPITAFCDSHRYSTTRRVELFESVCAAVSYAHRCLIVHRDLKPSNLLVDREGRPKLLDFGIATLLTESESAAPSTATLHAGAMLTPLYAAPEQIRGRPATTATDVYALGLLLHELLTGVKARRTEEVARLVFEQPEWMPQRIHEVALLGDDALSRAAARETTPRALAAELRGDLETIVRRATAPDPERRYRSVDELTSDLAAWRAGRPIRARGDSRWYVLRKLAARHRVGVAAVVAILVSIVAGMATTLRQAGIAFAREQEAKQAAAIANANAERANQVKRFVESLFRNANPINVLTTPPSLREVLLRGADRIDDELAGQPIVQAELAAVVTDALWSLGLWKDAFEISRRHIEWSEAAFGGSSTQVAKAYEQFGYIAARLDLLAEARAATERSIEIGSALGESFRESVLLAKNSLANILQSQGELAQAERLVRETLAEAESYGFRTTTYRGQLLKLLVTLGRDPEALPLAEETLVTARAEYPEDHPAVLLARTELAVILKSLGKAKESLEILRDVVSRRERLESSRSAELALSLKLMGQSEYELGLLTEAEQHACEALAIYEAELGEHSCLTQSCRSLLAMIYNIRGVFPASLEIQRELIASDLNCGGEDGIVNRWNLAYTLKDIGALAEAVEVSREAVALAELRTGIGGAHAVRARYELARILRVAGDSSAAAAELETARPFLITAYGDGSAKADRFLVELVNTHMSGKRSWQALDAAIELVAFRERTCASDDPAIWEAHILFGITLNAIRDFARGDAVLAEASERLTSACGANDLRTLRAEMNRALAEEGLGRIDAARTRIESVLDGLASLPEPPPPLVNFAKGLRKRLLKAKDGGS